MGCELCMQMSFRPFISCRPPKSALLSFAPSAGKQSSRPLPPLHGWVSQNQGGGDKRQPLSTSCPLPAQMSHAARSKQWRRPWSGRLGGSGRRVGPVRRAMSSFKGSRGASWKRWGLYCVPSLSTLVKFMTQLSQFINFMPIYALVHSI